MKREEGEFIGKEEYSPGYRKELVNSYNTRRIDIEAAFLAPYLRPGMRMLDCGCGPGSITLGIAGVVRPGVITGVDINPEQVKHARRAAIDSAIENAEFTVGSIYELPFDDASFDAVLAHAVLQHLARPEAALDEVFRVLKPGGVIGVRDDDIGSLIIAPMLPHLDRALEVIHEIVRISGGDPTVGRHYRRLLRASGFSEIVISTTTECDETIEATTKRGNLAAVLLEHMAEKAVSQSLSTEEEVPALISAVRDWGRHPDAFDSITWCEAVARKP